MPITGPANTTTSNRYEDEQLPRNTVHEVVEAKLYAVKYTDGYGKTQMRFATTIGGQTFLLPQDMAGQSKAVQKWFSDQMAEKLGQAPKKTTRRRRTKAEGVKTKKAEPKIKPMNVEAI